MRRLILLMALALASALLTTPTAGATTLEAAPVFSRAVSNPIGTAQAYPFTADDGGTVDRLSLYLDGANAASRLELGLYSGTTSNATSRLGSCAIATPQTDAWNSCTIPAATVTAGATYWLAYLEPTGSSGTLQYREGIVPGAATTYMSEDHGLASLPSTWSNGTAYWGGYRASIYADQSAPPGDDEGDSAPPARATNCAPSVGHEMTNAVSHLCGFADITNTGPAPGTMFKRVPEDITAPDATTGHGWHYDASLNAIVLKTDGALLQNVHIDGETSIQDADDVTIQDVEIHAPYEDVGVQLRHAENATIQDSHIWGSSDEDRMLVGVKDIFGDAAGLQVLRNDIHGWSTGVQVETGVIEGNYIHDPGFREPDHINGVTSNGGEEPLIIRGNTVLNSVEQTDAISLFEDFSVQGNRVIDQNLVAGGSYCIYGGQNDGGPAAHNVQITNNHFSRMYSAKCGEFGPLAAWPLDGPGGVLSANVWDDTGEPYGS
jgi:hypothetical protein